MCAIHCKIKLSEEITVCLMMNNIQIDSFVDHLVSCTKIVVKMVVNCKLYLKPSMHSYPVYSCYHLHDGSVPKESNTLIRHL